MTAAVSVCFLTGTLNAFAGAERMTAVIANRLTALGFRVHVLSLWDRRSCFPLDERVAHHSLFESRPSFEHKYLATTLGIRKYLREHRIDVLVEVDTMLSLFTVPAALGLPTRRIAWEHCHFDEDLGKKARRVARRLAALTNSAIVVLTERDRQRWQQALSPRIPIHVIPNPLPFPYPAQAVSGDAKSVLAVGRLTAVKGFDVLLDAWAIVQAHAPEWTLKIVGEGEERERLEAQAERLGIASSVSMPGTSANIESSYQSASILCMTSRYEGFGMVLIEAMAHGLAVVSTNCEAGPRELLADQNAIPTVPVDDVQSTAAALQKIMEDETSRMANALGGRQLAGKYTGAAVDELWQGLLKVESGWTT
nr:glycosyltransferase [uncultured Cupriavidus sp.]